jgi:hypothetical protein
MWPGSEKSGVPLRVRVKRTHARLFRVKRDEPRYASSLVNEVDYAASGTFDALRLRKGLEPTRTY